MMETIYFYCDWDSKQALISNTITDPKYIFLQGVVNWRNETTLVELAYYSKTDLLVKTDKKAIKNSSMISLLKSNLQKQVRRQLSDAVGTFAELYDWSPFEALRRLVVIVFEDTMIHSQLSVIVWLMVASSKGYVLKSNEWVLDYVNTLLTLPKKCECMKGDINADKLLNSTHLNKEILCGIYFRTGYGGMKSDLELITSTINWYFQNNHELQLIEIKPFTDTLNFTIHYSALDFHVFPNILSELQEQFPQYTIEMLKEIIWTNCSGVNTRIHNKPVDPRWFEIKTEYKKLGKKFLEKCSF